MVQTVVWSIVLRIRFTSRILWKHNLEVEEICCTNDRFLSKMTPRLRAESKGEIMTLLGRWMVGLLSLESCWGRTWMRNSVLEKLGERKLEDIQLDTLVIGFSRRVMLWDKSWAENDKRSWVPSAYRWWFAAEFDMIVLRYITDSILRGVVYKMKNRGPS